MPIKTQKKLNKKNEKGSTHVPGQYLGYSMQATRFVALLLQSDFDWKVSLEYFEDVGAEAPDGKKVAEQTKSALEGNPISDHAIDFWKTFSNWVDAANSGELPPEKTVFEIYVSKAKAGRIIESFAKAKSIDEAKTAIRNAKSALWGKHPKFELKSKVAATIKKYVNNVFETDETLVCQIIKSFNLVVGSGSPHSDLESLFRKAMVPKEILKDVILHALGWVKKKTDILIEQSRPAIISVEAFHVEIESFVRKLDKRTILASFAREPRQEEIEADKLRTYVRQLELIDSSDDDKIRAIIDFLKAAIDRTQWSIKGYVDESSFKEFEEGLQRVWQNLKTKVDIALKGRNDVELGKALYAECSIHHATLEGLETPNHFTPGSFHALADKAILGWHPYYLSILTASLVKTEEAK
jgi:hypothetical protein